MQQGGQMVNESWRPSGRRGDAWLTRSPILTMYSLRGKAEISLDGGSFLHFLDRLSDLDFSAMKANV
jgi:hypothetical protein